MSFDARRFATNVVVVRETCIDERQSLMNGQKENQKTSVIGKYCQRSPLRFNSSRVCLMNNSSTVHYQLGAFPPKELHWEALIPLLGPASAAVARYDGTLAAVSNAEVLLSPLMMTQEAVLSSRIEGTQATINEVLEFEADASQTIRNKTQRDDIQEVLNYRRAMRHAEQMLNELPLSLRVIRETHLVLLDGVRGHGKSPGQFRRIPNWIGPAGCSIEDARFVPIGADKLERALFRWERYIHEDTLDALVQLALLHAEFEALHPFLDGNGRLGRMLVPLFLWHRGLIRQPMFYISAYLETHRDEYYERLLSVSRNHDWTGWCGFFLKAIQYIANSEKRSARRHHSNTPWAASCSFYLL